MRTTADRIRHALVFEGLGLAIVAELCRHHGLHLRHRTQSGSGTCIAVEVPLGA